MLSVERADTLIVVAQIAGYMMMKFMYQKARYLFYFLIVFLFGSYVQKFNFSVFYAKVIISKYNKFEQVL